MLSLAALPAWVLTLYGRRLRKAGHYRRNMLEVAFKAWRLHSSARTLLHWAATRRDLGLPLSRRMAHNLLALMPSMPSWQRVWVLAGVAEAFPVLLSKLPSAWRQEAARKLPALGMTLIPDLSHQNLGAVAAQQIVLRQDFAHTVWASARRSGLAVVGNAAQLCEVCAGEAIDACSLVVRFNHYGRGHALKECVGNKIDVWVVSPAYKGPPPLAVPTWVVVTGPAMEYKLQNWQTVQPLVNQGSKLLTVPLKVWRTCVQQLQAPPSAGILMLSWLEHILHHQLEQVTVAGVGDHDEGRPYKALNAQFGSTSRHNWRAEAAWLKQRPSLRRLV